MRLRQSQIDDFYEQGYLQLAGVLEPADLNPVRWELEGIVDRNARRLFAERKITSLHEREPFQRRVAQIAMESLEILGDVSPHQSLGPAIFHLMCNPKLLDIVESLVGAEILCHPIHVLRARIPDSIAPWAGNRSGFHQDVAVVQPDGENTLMVTLWIPFVDATEKNGCVQVIHGSHKHGLRVHQWTHTYLIGEEELPPGERKPLETEAGGIAVFHPYLCHVSGENRSEGVRWTTDLRYQDPSQPTGHPYLSGFIARSRSNPASELAYPEWVTMWETALADDSPKPQVERWPRPEISA